MPEAGTDQCRRNRNPVVKVNANAEQILSHLNHKVLLATMDKSTASAGDMHGKFLAFWMRPAGKGRQAGAERVGALPGRLRGGLFQKTAGLGFHLDAIVRVNL